jgi:hypothetical protein
MLLEGGDMGKLGIAFAGAAMGLLASGARAADAPVLVVPTIPAAVIPVAVDPGFDWAGFYVGVDTTVVVLPGYGFGWVTPAAHAGVNVVLGPILFGAKGAVGWYFEGGGHGNDLTLQFEGRAGVALDRIAIYGLLGVVGYERPPNWIRIGGVGMELALGRRMSLFAEVRTEQPFQPPFEYLYGTSGVNWHLGN